MALAALVGTSRAQPAADGIAITQGRHTVLAAPADAGLARALLAHAAATDSFPGLPRSTAPVRIIVAPDAPTFARIVGRGAPEWGVAFAFPAQREVVMQGGRAGSAAGDPLVVLRHELAHLALHDRLGALPPRWFDEGYASVAAGEVSRLDALTTSLALVARGVPRLDSLDRWFEGRGQDVGEAYALAHTAVAELQALDPTRGLDTFLRVWHETLSYDQAMRQAYGLTAAEFDTRFRRAVRQRFGVLALVANLSLALGALTLVLAPLYVQRRRRDRARLEALRAADLAQEREAAALAALLAVDHAPVVSADGSEPQPARDPEPRGVGTLEASAVATAPSPLSDTRPSAVEAGGAPVAARRTDGTGQGATGPAADPTPSAAAAGAAPDPDGHGGSAFR